jgi:hypothetical protein
VTAIHVMNMRELQILVKDLDCSKVWMMSSGPGVSVFVNKRQMRRLARNRLTRLSQELYEKSLKGGGNDG